MPSRHTRCCHAMISSFNVGIRGSGRRRRPFCDAYAGGGGGQVIAVALVPLLRPPHIIQPAHRIQIQIQIQNILVTQRERNCLPSARNVSSLSPQWQCMGPEEHGFGVGAARLSRRRQSDANRHLPRRRHCRAVPRRTAAQAAQPPPARRLPATTAAHHGRSTAPLHPRDPHRQRAADALQTMSLKPCHEMRGARAGTMSTAIEALRVWRGHAPPTPERASRALNPAPEGGARARNAAV